MASSHLRNRMLSTVQSRTPTNMSRLSTTTKMPDVGGHKHHFEQDGRRSSDR
jgi:hypothetical protein